MVLLWNRKHVPDEGWCWVMFMCSNIIMFLVFGVHYTYGTLYPHLLKEFNKGESNTAWIGSLSSGLLFLSSFPAILFYKLTSASTTCLIGSILSGSSLIMTSYIQDFRWLYLVYGCFFGIGSSFLYTPVLIMLAKWFVKYRTITTGIASASGALGAIVLSPLIQYTIKHNGLRVTLKSAGICYISISILCSLSYRPLRKVKKDETKVLIKNYIHTVKKKNVLKELFSNRSFLMYIFVMMITNFTYYIPIIHLVHYTEIKLNVSPSKASLLISIWSISSIIGRILFGKFVGYFNRHILRCYQISMFLSGCITTITYFSSTYWMLVGYVVSYGFLDGSFIGLLSLTTLDLVGFECFDQGFGLMLTSIGLPIAFGPPIIGFINDKNLLPTQSMFLIAGIPFVIGSLLMTFVIKWKPVIKDTYIETDENLNSAEEAKDGIEKNNEKENLLYITAV